MVKKSSSKKPKTMTLTTRSGVPISYPRNFKLGMVDFALLKRGNVLQEFSIEYDTGEVVDYSFLRKTYLGESFLTIEIVSDHHS